MAINSLNGNAINQINQTHQSLLQQFEQLSSGKRVNSAADDAAGYAIATSLNTQAAAASTASENIQNVYNATNVAQGALSQLNGVLQSLNNLAITGANSFLSPADRNDLQAQANQLVQQANTIAQSVNFNGQQLLNGQFAGPNAGTAATASVTNNDIVQQGGGVVAQVTAANPNYYQPPASGAAAQGFGGTATTNSTIQVQVVNNNGQAAAVATVLNNATGQTATSAPVAAGGTISGFENVNIKVGNISLADVGQTATIQIAQATPANSQNSALTVQSGANEGNTTNVNIPGTNSNTLQISNINLSSPLSSQQAIGQVQNALNTLTTQEAQLGAQQISLQNAAQADDVYSNNLTSSASSITDENVGAGVTQSTLSQLQQQIQLALLAKNNVNSLAVLGLFGQ
ncbi:MAG TPA: hypothetical protein VMA98_02660 [Candidatus Acidoferrales bacterium]|nr:hypothetical protein [Candidatus Acidoferrales bacterium]